MNKYLFVWSIVLLLVVGCSPAYEYAGTAYEPPQPIPDFELTAGDGQPFHLSDTRGHFTLVYFGYTFCPDVCPTTMADVKQALSGLEGREQVRVLFISVDPERDTPEVVGRYAAAFDPAFTGLTGDMARIQEVMQPFGAYAEKAEATDSAAGYLVNHTARLYLLNPAGELVLSYPFGFEPDALQADLQQLLQ